jgi:hypothetical protein
MEDKKGGSVSKVKGKLVSIVGNELPNEFIDYVISKDRKLKKLLKNNPNYRELLHKSFQEASKEYGVYYNWAKAIDKWDRYTSAIGLASEVVPVIGNIFSEIEEVGELIPKSVYAVNYIKKTGDYMAVPYWALHELASFLPWIGELVDMKNIYINRTRKTIARAMKKRFFEKVAERNKASKLEKKLDPEFI